MGRLSKSAIVILAALAVCAVLITPALDELPSALPRVLHHAIALPVTNASVDWRADAAGYQPSVSVAVHASPADLLSLMCARLC